VCIVSILNLASVIIACLPFEEAEKWDDGMVNGMPAWQGASLDGQCTEWSLP
jgi:hypothetical protein